MSKDLNTVKLNLNTVQIEDETPSRPRYHHGDLHHSLIEAGEAILLERGVSGFSLREAARRAGVSAGAPAHHFGDAKGLLTAIAALGFKGLYDALKTADEQAANRHDRIRAQGVAYIDFALSQPARFDLMWQRDLLNTADETYARYASAAFQVLQDAVTGDAVPVDPCVRQIDPRVIAAWSLVHGYACLARQNGFPAATPGLVAAVLDCLEI